MKNIIILSLIIATTLFGCVADDEFDAPDLSGLCNNSITANKEISNLSSISNPTLYTADDVIEGYVVSSDEDGNFYKSISIQKEDGSIGFTVPVDQTNLHNEYRPGTKVTVKLKDRYVGRSNSMITIGNLFEGSVGRIGATEYKNVIFRKCGDTRTDDQLVKVRTIAEAAQNQYLNTLIEIQNVQFSDASLNKKFFDISLNNIGGATNHDLLQIGGGSVVVRVSEFASFANKPIPSGNGKIRGIMTKFGSTFQFMIVSYKDINLTNPRIIGQGGTAITYTGNFTENFESYAANLEAFPKYVNVADKGTKYWRLTSFGGNKYIQMSAFSSATSGQEQLNRTLFIVPVDFTAANSMSFKTKAGFDNGAVLKVYTTTNYIPLGNINNATLTDITSSFALSSGSTSGYPANFTNSGVYNFPAGLTGNGFVVFEYTGGYSFSPARTTTMQIDDIVVN